MPRSKTGNKKIGRPSKFDTDMMSIVTNLTKKGATQAEIAAIIGVDTRTLQRWMSKNEDFRRVVREGRSVSDEMVEISLFKLANGYSLPESKFFPERTVTQEINPETKSVTKKVVTEYKPKTVMKFFPPDQRAIAFWLKNRSPSKWKDKNETDITSSDGSVKIVFEEHDPDKQN